MGELISVKDFEPEKAILVAVQASKHAEYATQDSLDELAQLCETWPRIHIYNTGL